VPAALRGGLIEEAFPPAWSKASMIVAIPLSAELHRRAATRRAAVFREPGHDERYLGTFSSR
jgi:hypothetical protein